MRSGDFDNRQLWVSRIKQSSKWSMDGGLLCFLVRTMHSTCAPMAFVGPNAWSIKQHTRRLCGLRHARTALHPTWNSLLSDYPHVPYGAIRRNYVIRFLLSVPRLVLIQNICFVSSTYNGFQRDAFSLRSWLVGSLPSSVYALGDYNFVDLVLKSPTPWVVDFYAPWCGPCQAFAVEFELAAKQLDNGHRLKFAKVNCEHFPQLCQSAGVQAYPTVRYYSGKTGWSLQNPFGIPFVNDRRKVEDVVEWLEELLVSHSRSASANKAASSRDEL